MAVLIARIRVLLGEPDNFLRVNSLAVNDSGDLPVGSAGVEADAAAVQMAAQGLGSLVGSGALIQRQRNDLQLLLIKLLEEVIVKSTLAIDRIGGLQFLGQLITAADIDLEATDGPQQELHIPLHIPVVSLSHFSGSVDLGVVNGNIALILFNSNGNGLSSTLQVALCPQAEGDKFRIQFRDILHVKRYA